MKKFAINFVVLFVFMALLKLFNSYNDLSFILGGIAEFFVIFLDNKFVKS